MLVLVTGASAGFGEATCRLLVQKGHKVIGAARRLERLQALQQDWAMLSCLSAWMSAI